MSSTVHGRLHGPASVIWLVLFAIHGLVYLERALTSSRQELVAAGRAVQGRRVRSYLIAATVVTGLVIGGATVPTQHHWVNLPRDHHRGDHGSAAGTPR
jgi:hypothetical protein